MEENSRFGAVMIETEICVGNYGGEVFITSAVELCLMETWYESQF